jgi:hypothetical protein
MSEATCLVVAMTDLRTGEQLELLADFHRHLLEVPAGLDAERMQAVANGELDPLGEFRFLHVRRA